MTVSHGPGVDNPAPHVEGSAECRWLRMRFTPEALVQMADAAGCDVVIGEPDDDGFVEPIFTLRAQPAPSSRFSWSNAASGTR